MIGEVITLLMMNTMVAIFLIGIQGPGTDFSPLIRDPKRGEPRYRYWLSQLPRASLWIPAGIVAVVWTIPHFVRYLREPIRENNR